MTQLVRQLMTSRFNVESDVAISFSATTDSGITTTMTYGFDDTDGAADDANATISGDFGSNHDGKAVP